MRTATRTSDARVARHAPRELVRLPTASGASAAGELALARAFAGTVLCYLFRVLPQVGRELAGWRARAAAIPNPRLRQAAGEALAKRGNVEGAALFATLAPAAHRHRTVRALVAYQTAYNYLDALSERPSEDPVANGDQLHQALLVALCPGAPHPDYYEHNPDRGDGEYLPRILEACRDAVAGLPSYAAVAPAARAAAARIVDFQALNLSERQGGHGALERWAASTPSAAGLAWWETAAAAGSSLAVYALIAAAADPRLHPRHVPELDGAYFPWIGALHSLLDSLVDRGEDHVNRQRSLLSYYHSSTGAAIHLAGLAGRAAAATERLPNPEAHRVILAAMCSYYLSAPECATAEGQTIARALTRAVGLPLAVAIPMFRSRRRFHSLTRRAYT
jgi:tetraprenyl-beta-curcumene synthase